MQEAKIWVEKVTIPTYLIGEPDKNPMFLEKRVYQGSSGKVYPLPVIETITDTKVDKEYTAIFLENKYIKVMILPELGGRIQRALDKTNNFDFVYYNEVIKPALVGLVGPWISGGIEFNWPQHHRPSTFMPTEYVIEDNPDGSKTCFISEIDTMYGTKGMASFTIYPDKAYIEIKGQLYNRTEIPQTFLWWANPAFPANDYTQSIFPPDVNAVLDHGKRAVSTFPIATGTYYKVDYSKGVDISRYKNIPVPTSYMAYHSDFDFVGAYDHQKRAGIMHYASHHISPGKKQWTWGNGDFGHAWDRNLTDENGPYIELMTGVYTDNQPDFTWLQPYEEKTFKQYFMPYKLVGNVKNATLDAMVNLDVNGDEVYVGVYVTSEFKDLRILLTDTMNNQVLLDETLTLTPETAYEKTLKACGVVDKNLLVQVISRCGRVLVAYQPQEYNNPVPDPAERALEPEEYQTNEELYLTALHLEQYRHATFEPDRYYLEGLKRDKTDFRINNAYGLLLYRRGLFEQSLQYFDAAIKKATWRNPNPYDSEPFYNKGLALWKLGRLEEAYAAFYKATWSAHQQEPGFYSIACIDAIRDNYQLALEHVEKGLIKNSHNMKARGLKASILRKLERHECALNFVKESIKIDRLDHYARYELYKLTKNEEDLADFQRLMRNYVNNYLVLALDYAQAGFYQEAIEVLDLCQVESPLIYYYKAYFYDKMENSEKARENLKLASEADPSYCFPNKLDEIIILQRAIELNPNDAFAYYYLGNIWYDKKQYAEAIKCWEQSAKLNPNYPTVQRNLALAYYNKENNPEKARKALETAFYLDPTDARILLELDQLYKITNVPHEIRLAFLNKYYDTVVKRDDLYLEYCALHNYVGDFDKAYELIMARKFHPWEGGEGKVPAQYKHALLKKFKRAYQNENYEEALTYLQQSCVYPHNLGEGKLYVDSENNIHYYLGLVYDKLGRHKEAIAEFEKATLGIGEITATMYYNDVPADYVFFKGLALEKLGKHDEAKEIFNNLINYGKEHMNDNVKIDYFAVSLPDFLIFESDLNKNNVVHCNYLIGLGLLGLNNKEEAKEHFERALKLDINHLSAKTFLEEL